jgi:hypothetical protein
LKAVSGQTSPPPDDGEGLERLETKVDALCRAVDELRQIVCAQAIPATTS